MRKAFLRRHNVVCFSLVIASLIASASVKTAIAASAQHVKDAESLLANLSISKRNTYASNPSYIMWSGKSSQARTVCGTFITNLLLHSYSLTTGTFSDWLGTTSPDAEGWRAAIVAQNRFTRITDIADVQAGDIISVKYSGESISGHAMLIDSVAQSQTAKSPVVSGTKQYIVTVIDSSSSHHGASDTRVTSPSSTGNGIGRGTLRIYVDSSRRPVGYSWSNDSGSPYFDISERPFAIGRLRLTSLGVKSVATDDDTLSAEDDLNAPGGAAQLGSDPSMESAETADQVPEVGCSFTAFSSRGVASPAAAFAALILLGCLVALREARRVRAAVRSR